MRVIGSDAVRQVALAAVLGLAFALVGVDVSRGWAAEAGPSGGAPVQVAGGRVTVQLHAVSLVSVLRDIGRQAGLPITVLGANDLPVSMSFRDQPVDEALKLLMRGSGGGVLLYEQGAAGPLLVGAYVTVERGGAGLRDPSGSPGPAVPPSGPVQERAGVTAASPDGGRASASSRAAAEEAVESGTISDFLPAAQTLHPDKTPLDAVSAVARDHPNPSARVNALSVLAEIGTMQDTRSVFQRATSDPDPMVSELAKRMLGLPMPDKKQQRSR